MNGKPGGPIRKFSPGTCQSDGDVTEQFVVREHELGALLDVLRGNIESRSCQHALIVAPRGHGKSMLLARTAAEIRISPELAQHFLPVSFVEESQEIFSLTDFWLEALFHLARECASHDPRLAGELRERHTALSERWREQALEDHVLAAVLDAADRLDRKLVLMVENLQTLWKDVNKDFGWKLRGVLQTEPQIILLASAASRFAGLDDVEQPFFEMFRIIELKPLTTAQCRKLWEVVSGDKVTERAIRPLEILVAGSPRLLVIVAGFGQHNYRRRLIEDLVMLIDDHTEYFRGHLEVLGKTERRTYTAVLDLWQHSTPGEIAARARMDVRVVSTMLGRLVKRGALVVEGGGRKRKYAAAEPLYCIYYKLRRGRGEAAVVENLIRFMSVFYGEAERTEMFPSLISQGWESSTLRHGLDRAAAELPEFARFLVNMRQPAIAASRPGETEPVRRTLQELVGSADAAMLHDDPIGQLLRELSAAFERIVEIEDRSASIQNLSPDSLSQAIVARALTMKGDALRTLGNLDSALCVCENAIERFHASEDPHVQALVARAIGQKGQVHEQSGNPKSALLAYNEIVDRVGGSEYPAQREWAAWALIRKGHILREAAESESALSVYEEVMQRFGTSENPGVRQWVALAMIDKAGMLVEMGRVQDALNTCDDVDSRLCNLDDERKRELVWRARQVRRALLAQPDLPAAMDMFRSLHDTFVSDDDGMMRDALELIPELIAAGASVREVLDILSSDPDKAAVLTPLVVALRQHSGEAVEGPREVLQVAADVQERIQEAGARNPRTRSGGQRDTGETASAHAT